MSCIQRKPIPGLPGYEADSRGQIYGKRGHALSPCPAHNGYLKVSVVLPSGKQATRRVSRLVCRAFHGAPPFEGAQASHLSGDKTDNRPDNLAWESAKQNCARKVAHGTQQTGARNGNARLTREQVVQVFVRVYAGESQAALAREFGVDNSTVNNIKSGRTWTHVTRHIGKSDDAAQLGLFDGEVQE